MRFPLVNTQARAATRQEGGDLPSTSGCLVAARPGWPRRLFCRHTIEHLAVGILGILLAVIVLEAGLRSLFSYDHKYYVWPPYYEQVFTPEPGAMPGVDRVARFKINSHGIRAREWSQNPDSEYRILAVGGSGTESLYLDQDIAWPALLESQLRRTADDREVWVGNVGRSGLDTRDHLALVRLAIGQYDINSVIVMAGVNDLQHRLVQGDAYDPYFTDDATSYWKKIVSRSFAIVPIEEQLGATNWLQGTAIWNMARRLYRVYEAKTGVVRVQDNAGHQYVEYRAARQSSPVIDQLPSLDTALDEFERNIVAISTELHRRNIRLVLVTQPVLWKPVMSEQETRLLWGGMSADGRYYSASALAAGMDAYNRRLLDTCDRLGLECYDLAAHIPQTADVFYDDMHFTEAGSLQVTTELRAYLQSAGPFAGSRMADSK
jgi:lysophospholipase L1-like esterase